MTTLPFVVLCLLLSQCVICLRIKNSPYRWYGLLRSHPTGYFIEDVKYLTELHTLYDEQICTKDISKKQFMNTISYSIQKQDTHDIKVEFLNLEVETSANSFRRNIALRLNRVLNPARNAQIFTNLYCSLLSEGYLSTAIEMSSYVGFSPLRYYSNTGISLNDIATYIIESMLELNFETLAWIASGKNESNKPKLNKDKGVSPQEWFYTQIERDDVSYRVQDMILSAVRLAVRYGCKEYIDKSQYDDKLVINLWTSTSIDRSNIGINGDFKNRLRKIIEIDMTSNIPHFFEHNPLPVIEFLNEHD